MKNIILHYLALLLPLLAIIYSYKFFTYSSILFLILLFAWALIYHPYLKGRRLYKKGLTSTIKWAIGLYRHPKEFKEVYFKP